MKSNIKLIFIFLIFIFWGLVYSSVFNPVFALLPAREADMQGYCRRPEARGIINCVQLGEFLREPGQWVQCEEAERVGLQPPPNPRNCCIKKTADEKICNNGPNQNSSNGCGQSCGALCRDSKFIPVDQRQDCLNRTKGSWQKYRIKVTKVNVVYRINVGIVGCEIFSYTKPLEISSNILVDRVCSITDKFNES